MPRRQSKNASIISWLYVYYRTDLSNYCGPFPSSASPCRTIPRFLQLALCPRSSDTLSPTVTLLNMNSLQQPQSLGQLLFLWSSECFVPRLEGLSTWAVRLHVLPRYRRVTFLRINTVHVHLKVSYYTVLWLLNFDEVWKNVQIKAANQINIPTCGKFGVDIKNWSAATSTGGTMRFVCGAHIYLSTFRIAAHNIQKTTQPRDSLILAVW